MVLGLGEKLIKGRAEQIKRLKLYNYAHFRTMTSFYKPQRAGLELND